MARFAKLWPALSSGLLVVLSFPPFHLGLLCFIALVPWLGYLSRCDGKAAFRSGVVFGIVFWLGEFSFVAKFVSHWTGSLWLGLVPYLLGTLIGSLYFALFGWLANISYRRSAPWVIPVLWAGVEVLRSYIFGLAFPFGLLAMPLTPWPAIIQSAHYGSVFLTSAWVALGSVVVASLVNGARVRSAIPYLAVFAAILGLSLARYSVEPTGNQRILVAGQPGVDMAFGDQSEVAARITRQVNSIVKFAEGADLLVLPEGITRSGESMPPPIPFQLSPSLPVVFGGQRGSNPGHQSAFSFDGTWRYADKTRLVIFGEYVPFRGLPLLDKFDLPGGDLVPGEEVKTLPVGKFRVGSALCFEALFPDVPYRAAAKGANLLAVMSIDDWYMGTNAPEQLRDATNWRAIEMGVPAVRAASLGYSMICDARGRTIAEAPLMLTTPLAAEVTVPDRPDLFRFLPVFPYVSLLALLLVPVWDLIAARMARRRGG